jgi:membrane fusion protein (multidrug efflux system)
MQKRILIGVVVVATLMLIIGGLYWEKFPHQIGTMASAANVVPVEAVTTALATQQTWNPVLASVGSITAENGVTISAEVAGTVAKIEFESGAKVAAGALLAQLDVRVEEAQLKSAEARAELARLNAERVRELRRQTTVAQADLDAAEAQFKGATADAEALRAAIEKKTFRAPFDGRLGIRQVSVGQFVNNGNPIVTLEALAPLYVDFSLPQQNTTDLAVGQEVRVTTDGAADTTFAGLISAIDPRVDPNSRNLRVRATLTRPDGKLRPGMFANVDVVLPSRAPVIVIPSSAVLYAPYGDSVFIVETRKNAQGVATKVVRQAFVRLGIARGDFVAVISGVKAGDEIVSTGAFKLRNDAPVNVQNGIVPPGSLNPQPENS